MKPLLLPLGLVSFRASLRYGPQRFCWGRALRHHFAAVTSSLHLSDLLTSLVWCRLADAASLLSKDCGYSLTCCHWTRTRLITYHESMSKSVQVRYLSVQQTAFGLKKKNIYTKLHHRIAAQRCKQLLLLSSNTKCRLTAMLYLRPLRSVTQRPHQKHGLHTKSPSAKYLSWKAALGSWLFSEIIAYVRCRIRDVRD